MMLVAILEDDSRRIAAMRNISFELLADYKVKFFDNAHAMSQWLAKNIGRCDVLSLDCDLDSTILMGEDCGSGEDVTKFLTSASIRCPVIIHSSNALRAPAMHMELALAGWTQVWLCPFSDARQWASDIRRARESR